MVRFGIFTFGIFTFGIISFGKSHFECRWPFLWPFFGTEVMAGFAALGLQTVF